MQLTWKDNYNDFKNFYNTQYPSSIDPISNPDILSTDITLSTISALWFFKQRVLNRINLNENTSVQMVTKLINGANNGLKERQLYTAKAKLYIKCN